RARTEVEFETRESVDETRLGLVATEKAAEKVDVAAPPAREPFDRMRVEPTLRQRVRVEKACTDGVVVLARPRARLDVEHTREPVAVARRRHAAEEIELRDAAGIEQAEQTLHVFIVERLEEPHPIQRDPAAIFATPPA